ncbi:MAG: hypothetical protein ACKV2Q_16410 [Planctomycetaceae bacterium]
MRAAMSSTDESEPLVMDNNEEFMKLLADASRQVEKTGGIPHDEFWRRNDAKYSKKSNGKQKRKGGK